MSGIDELRDALEGTIEEVGELSRSIKQDPPEPEELPALLQNTLTLLSDLAETVKDLLDEIE